jgi:integrase
MTKHNPENERIKRQYFAYLKEAKRHSEQTVDAAAKALSRFEEYTRHRDFKAFRHEQAIAFKRYLAEQTGKRSGEKLSKATLHATLKQLRAFFFWLAGQPRYKARLQYSDADYFNLSEKDARIATAQRERKTPTLEQVKCVIQTMPGVSEIERRNRALMAFTLLTGARDSAIASMKLKHVDLIEGCVYQDAREVKTKFSKTFVTYFFPVGDEIRHIVAEWVRFLREEKLWGNDDPLFPATRVALGQERQFEAAGLDRAHWSTATPIRSVFRGAFERADVPYFHPHSLRKTLARLGEQFCKTPEEFKAWSQNLGHEQVLTTFTSYGAVRQDRQGEIIRGIGSSRQPIQSSAEEIAEAVAKRLRGEGTSVQATSEQYSNGRPA